MYEDSCYVLTQPIINQQISSGRAMGARRHGEEFENFRIGPF